ncbi:MAG: UbiA family prenyltransferase [Armatimonadetes bacterium]|nr:UbiA family prenyltransferase [Armatimonadota bacterium]
MSAASGTNAARVYLEMIKIEHSIFALPFAMVGMMYASGDGWPGWRVFLLILLAMVSARSAAMAFNRIADAKIDAENPRTATRAIPAGLLKRSQALRFLVVSCAVFFVAAGLLNRLTLILAPLLLAVLMFYTYTKRFTALCHLFVGLSLGLAPAGAWVAVTGEFSWTPLFWILAVMFWTGGFDVLYALQDEEFDHVHGVHSIPVSLGRANAIIVSRLFHLLAVLFLAAAGVVVGAGIAYFLGVLFAAALLTYEQSLVSANDISKLNFAFFTLNGYVSLGFFLFALADALLRLA